MKKTFPDVEDVLTRAVRGGAFPGCVAAIGTATERPWVRAFGKLGEGLGSVAADTLYDVASLTKVLATTVTAMTLHRDGLLDLGQKMGELLADFAETPMGKSGATVEHALAHCAGWSDKSPLYRRHSDYRSLVAAIASQQLAYAPAMRSSYSDFGMILLGEGLARLGDRPFATLAWTRVFQPLGMRQTFFRPAETERPRIAPTEVDRHFRHRLIHGEGHDEHAFVMGGVAGHAGVFTTAADVARLAAEMLRARAGSSEFMSKAVADLFTTRRGIVAGSTRALGWDTPSEQGSSAGDLLSRRSFGHTGFTGTSVWCDPDRGIYAVLLSNRVHPSRENIKIRAVRREFHDAVARATS